MKIVIGADHRGFNLKQSLIHILQNKGHEIVDVGSSNGNESDDYPVFAKKAADGVIASDGSRGIVICGSGTGVDIVANKIDGIRCCLAINEQQVAAARQDDDVNMLALAADFNSDETAQRYVDTFLSTAFENSESHSRRIREITEIEQS